MPDFGISEIAGLIAAISGAGGAATSIYQATNQPGQPKPAVPTPAQNAATAGSNRATQEAALSQQLPNLQSQVGGSLSPEALMQLSQLLTGSAGTPGIGASSQDLIQKMTVSAGAPSGSNPATPGSPGLTPVAPYATA
jgi:hypothetical protein